MNKQRIRPGSIIASLFLLVFSLSCIYPAFWLLTSSFKNKSEFTRNPVALPSQIDFTNIRDVFGKSQIGLWLVNTFRNTVIAVFLTLLISFILGYFLSRFHFKGRKVLYSYLLIGMLVPIHALMIPIYVLFTRGGLTDQWYTLILPYTAFGLPLSTFLVESFVHTLPREVEEAASIDGSSFRRILFTIILPMCVPILVTAGILSVFANWNEFTFALILISQKSLMTIPVGLTLFKGQFSTNYPMMMTSMLIGLFLPMVFYFAFSKQIIKGTVTGAVKG